MKKYGKLEIYLKYSWCQHYMDLNNQLHAQATLTPDKEHSAPIL
jgi:hypothetical protein